MPIDRRDIEQDELDCAWYTMSDDAFDYITMNVYIEHCVDMLDDYEDEC